jgi:uncharacterized membrane protein/thiol-disulfide isomerase/thioredoxin
MPIFSNHSNVESVVIKLLRKLSIHIPSYKITSELRKHPEYHSLLAINDILNNFGIETKALRIDNNELDQVSCPFIAHTSLNKGDFVLVTQLDANKVVLSSHNMDNYEFSLKAFKNLFTGIVLFSPQQPVNEHPISFKKIEQSYTLLKNPLCIAILSLAIVSALVYHTSLFEQLTIPILFLIVLKTAGLFISLLLLIHGIDAKSPLVQKFCKTGEKINCTAILSSKAASIFKGLTWSDVGFLYFSATTFYLLFEHNYGLSLNLLAILNLLSLPYTVYSIYYQTKIKQWCLLCCLTQLILWLEFGILSFSNKLSFNIPHQSLTTTQYNTLIVCFLVPIAVLVLVKSLLGSLYKSNIAEKNLRKFKYNSKVFELLLHEQPKFSLPNKDWSIVLGNEESNNIITMVSNPYCGPCADTHKLLDELLSNNTNLQARIVFTAKNVAEDYKTPVSRYLMALNELSDKSIIQNALNHWYKEKRLESLSKKYPIAAEQNHNQKLDKQKEWCEIVEITETPTILVNGRRIPDLYSLADLKYMF